MKKLKTLILLLLTALAFPPSSAVDFIFNGFNSTDVSIYGNATIEDRILTLNKETGFAIGRGLYSSKIPAKQPNSSIVLPFSTSFIFSMVPYANRQPGHGIVFIFVPHQGIEGAEASQHLGLLNFTNNGDPNNHLFGVEFDCFRNQEFNDTNDNHVGIDVNSLISVTANEAGYWSDESSFEKLTLNNGRNYQVWIDYSNNTVNVTIAPAGMRKPNPPLLSAALNLSEVFEDNMYVGFTASTGDMIQSHRILSWSFSNTNSSIGDALFTQDLPSFQLPTAPSTTGFIVGVVLGIFLFSIICCAIALFFMRRNRRLRNADEEMEDWELEYWPHRISYQEIDTATKSFAPENVIGIGGNGKVYKGVLPGGSKIAVKRISHESGDGVRAFLAEISSLGRVKHRNLVGLKGWCKKEKGSLILVYEYMENGSLDRRVFDCDDEKTWLGFDDRIRILKQVASGILYLHHGWEAKVLHRDIKASNVLLDKDMNARLSDFGLAKMHDHDKAAGTTRVVGTVGYLAPEIVKSGRASTQSDVFSYGVLVLEVVCGRRPIVEGKPPLVQWVWENMRRGELLSVVDKQLIARGRVDEEEAKRMLQLGLLCANPNPAARPTMRRVAKMFEERGEFEGEAMDVYLLESSTSAAASALGMEHEILGNGLHPTFAEIRQGLSSSMSLSWSNTAVEGR
ncbi:L-type lectin-domain containing receptor kinase VII.1-like [Andrographis paniculata]|uniref:L-type lectin-domain containing receptor kinase VII.1-like n=1 Tax=Andrographis paniculata TaxID=175694 RepID=UPI0021E9148D|nr:L-type lectin-domain containing receptor kinase VII.1-like [Andrographis paniculata]